MNWYLVKLVFQIICGAGEHAPQFDEQVRLVSAACEAEALEKASMFGEQEQVVFTNMDEQLVQWRYLDVTELYPLQEQLDGAEVFSAINEVSNAAGYVNLVRDKAASIQLKHTLQPTN